MSFWIWSSCQFSQISGRPLISSACILTTMSDMIEETVFSNWLSGMLSGIPDKTKLFLLPYCPNEFRFCSRVTTLFSKVLHFALSLSFSSCNRLITISLRLTISSFKLLIQLMIFSSSFTSGSWLEALSLSETLSCWYCNHVAFQKIKISKQIE